MNILRKRQPIILLFGDAALFYAALWLTLLLRYGEIPSAVLFETHAVPFSILFIVWILVFFIAGLYDKHTAFFRTKLPETILRTQTVNILIAALFFFFIPYFGITPKTNLIIYLAVSSVLVIVWRLYVFPLLERSRKEHAILVAGGAEARELHDEINSGSHYPIQFVECIIVDDIDGETLNNRLFAALRSDTVMTVVADGNNEKIRRILPHLYKPLFSETRFVDFGSLYEEIFERVPLSALYHEWFLENGKTGGAAFTVSKRLFDVGGGLILGVAVCIIAPFAYAAKKIEGTVSVLIAQKRIGLHNSEITVYKFRTMKKNDAASGNWVREHGTDNIITKTGTFLRKASIDEFPQAFNILKGDVSLIGPRSDIEGLGRRLGEEIPFYNFRYVVKPGITGWAQVRQRYAKGNISPQSTEESRLRLAYDLYYVKHRSFLLDLAIALRTIKTLLSRLM